MVGETVSDITEKTYREKLAQVGGGTNYDYGQEKSGKRE